MPPHLTRLKPLDLEILSALQADARAPFTKIGADLGVPESTVRKRVSRMEKQGGIQFSAFADPLRLGFHHWTLIRLRVKASQLNAVADRVAKFPETFFIGVTTGDHNLFVGGIFRSNDDLLEFLNDRMFKIAGIEKTSTVSVLEIVKRRGPVLSSPETRRKDRRPPAATAVQPVQMEYGIDPVDIDVIEQLQVNGRKSYSQIATALGVSEVTVQKRVTRLRERGIISFVAFTNPMWLELQHWSLFDLVVEPKHAKAAAAALAEFPQIVFVGLTAGEHDVFGSGIFKSNDDLLAFITQRLGTIPGVSAISTTNVIRVVKRELVFPVRSRVGIPKAPKP